MLTICSNIRDIYAHDRRIFRGVSGLIRDRNETIRAENTTAEGEHVAKLIPRVDREWKRKDLEFEDLQALIDAEEENE